jgi:hypothetical protein
VALEAEHESDECRLCSLLVSRTSWMRRKAKPSEQGLTLVHFSAQRKRFGWHRGCIYGLFWGYLWGVWGY